MEMVHVKSFKVLKEKVKNFKLWKFTFYQLTMTSWRGKSFNFFQSHFQFQSTLKTSPE